MRMAGHLRLGPHTRGLLLCILALQLSLQDSPATAAHSTAVMATKDTSAATRKALVGAVTTKKVAVTTKNPSVATHNAAVVAATKNAMVVATTQNAAVVATANTSAATKNALAATKDTSATTRNAVVVVTTKEASMATKNNLVVVRATKNALATTKDTSMVTMATKSNSMVTMAVKNTLAASKNAMMVVATTKEASAATKSTSMVTMATKNTSAATKNAVVVVAATKEASASTGNSSVVVVTNNATVVATPTNASLVATNTSMEGAEETMQTCQSFQCSGERCYQDGAHANTTATCHNQTHCQLYRFSSTNYTAGCSRGCSMEPCSTNSSRQPCALECCAGPLCLQLNATAYGDLAPTTTAPVPLTTTSSTSSTPRAPPQNGKVCAAFSCRGDQCFKGRKTTTRCILGQDFCEMKKMGLNYMAGCSRACKAAKPACAAGVKAACYQECCPATPKGSCLKLDGKVHLNSAGQAALAPLLQLMACGVVLLLNFRVSTSLWG
ncbi:uncharacterized protein LOC113459935 [Zonotrichia albicollis]|uniref:uncharacterized protein LOC113459935 n=1 Tax=Zonotrichia albicollis TaxID=44394 RepID=UPI003D80EC8C